MEIDNQSKVEDFELKTRIPFVKKEEYPFEAIIESVVPVKGRYDIDYRLGLTTPYGYREFDCWGINLTVLTTIYGKKSSGLIGKPIYLSINEKGHKVLRAVLR